jgi:hypothetical protein
MCDDVLKEDFSPRTAALEKLEAVGLNIEFGKAVHTILIEAEYQCFAIILNR